MRFNRAYTALLFAVTLLSSCATRGTVGNERVTVDFMPSGNLKYYVRPTRMDPAAGQAERLDIDFTFQRKNAEYATEAYVNFTLYTDHPDYVDASRFLLPDSSSVELTKITTFDRNVREGLIRVGTRLPQNEVRRVIETLAAGRGLLEVVIQNRTLRFSPSPELRRLLVEAQNR